ncbi:hypothetical protein [Lactococcus petauri]|uniref:hypothetical protein n=1 Tax=Lactococcus petauri TaxID=1940789 RepID=UPI001F579D58|nr:hypothetical protein [Lactococcus petauri]
MTIKKFKKNKGYESLSREFLQRNDLSLEARGLLAYMESMPDDYTFHKTQLYKCFDKNKKRSVERIWNELLDNNFIIAFSKRNGSKTDYEYLFTHEGFSEEEISELNEQYFAEGWDVAHRTGTNRKSAAYYQEKVKKKVDKPSKNSGVQNEHQHNSGISSGVQNEHLKMNSSKVTANKLTNKGLSQKEEEDELRGTKKQEKSKFEKIAIEEIPEALNMVDEISEEMDDPKQAKEVLRFEVAESLGALPKASQVTAWLEAAIAYGLENCQSYPHLAEYIAKNYKMRVQKWTVERNKCAKQQRCMQNIHIPMDGPWNGHN